MVRIRPGEPLFSKDNKAPPGSVSKRHIPTAEALKQQQERSYAMVDRERFVAVALLTSSDLQGVGAALRCVMPIEDAPEDFSELLAKIDEAEERSKLRQ
jgi:hypothetical protein